MGLIRERDRDEKKLLDELRAAEEAYRLASSRCSEVLKVKSRVDASGAEVELVIGEKEAAIERYVQALRTFTDLVVFGRRPHSSNVPRE